MLETTIVFRGKTLNGEWVEGLVSESKGYDKTAGGPCQLYISNKAGLPFAFSIRPETLGQWIGLYDISGKKIFTGDIVEMEGWSQPLIILPMVMGSYGLSHTYEPGYDLRITHLFKGDYDDEVNTKCTVISNIFDNSHLIGK